MSKQIMVMGICVATLVMAGCGQSPTAIQGPQVPGANLQDNSQVSTPAQAKSRYELLLVEVICPPIQW